MAKNADTMQTCSRTIWLRKLKIWPHAGQAVGQIKVTTAGGSTVTTRPLVVLEPVGLAGIFGRAWDAVRLWIK